MEEDIGSLPFEHITWIVNTEEDFECMDDEEEEMVTLRMVTIMDQRGVIITCDMSPPAKLNPTEHLKKALKAAMLQPMAGKPRKPMCVTFRNGPELSDMVLAELGIETQTQMALCGCVWDVTPSNLWACCKCRRRAEPRLFSKCSGCSTVVYCSRQCQKADFKHPHDMHGHRAWCQKMKTYVQNEAQLADLPFTFTSETTQKSFGTWQYIEFLKRCGVYGQGFWQRERPHKCSKHMPNYGDLQSGESPYVLTKETSILTSKPQETLCTPLSSWKEYYAWRGLDLNSPIAILLTMPLTLYYALTITPQHYLGKDVLASSHLTVHIIGAEKETDMLEVFQELNYLLPSVELNLLLVGPELSGRVCGKTYTMGNVRVNIKKGFYHQVNMEVPDLVIGFNAGLGAYVTWGDTLVKLKEHRIPAFFTDYCNYSCECGRSPVEGLCVGTISDITVNPFRSPVRKYCEEHVMPWYSNGFIYSLQYATAAVQ